MEGYFLLNHHGVIFLDNNKSSKYFAGIFLINGLDDFFIIKLNSQTVILLKAVKITIIQDPESDEAYAKYQQSADYKKINGF